jgi:hypothetical protein
MVIPAFDVFEVAPTGWIPGRGYSLFWYVLTL